MTDREFFIQTLADELPRFERVFRALPESKLAWRPHKKSRSALEILTSMTLEATTYPIFLKTGAFDFAKVPMPKGKTVNKLWPVFQKTLKQAKTLAAKMSESSWTSPAKMLSGGKLDWETTKGNMAWSLLLDLIHHRGQLSVYLRPMGGKVPPIYGPSGDSQG